LADTFKGIVLIETEVGTSRDVTGKIRLLPYVVAVDSVTGPPDVIVVIEAPDLDGVTSVVRDKIHHVEGVIRTTTCLSLNGRRSDR